MKYRCYMCGTFDGTDGNKYSICIPSPFEEFKKNGGHIRQLRPSSMGKYVTDELDFVDTDKSFVDVFQNMEKGKLYYVDVEAYSIEEMVNVS